jgi:hypothetical protein
VALQHHVYVYKHKSSLHTSQNVYMACFGTPATGLKYHRKNQKSTVATCDAFTHPSDETFAMFHPIAAPPSTSSTELQTSPQPQIIVSGKCFTKDHTLAFANAIKGKY